MSVRGTLCTANQRLHRIDALLVHSDESSVRVLARNGPGQVSQLLSEANHLGRWHGLVLLDQVLVLVVVGRRSIALHAHVVEA